VQRWWAKLSFGGVEHRSYYNLERAQTNGFKGGLGFWSWVQDADSTLKHVKSPKVLSDMFAVWGCVAKNAGGKNWLEFPPLRELRQRFDEKYGAQDWGGEGWEAEEWIEANAKAFADITQG
jgi:hypothetical protein